MIEIDEIIRTRRKTIALIVQRDGKVIVRAPVVVSDREIYGFVSKNTRWIQKQQALVKLKPPKAPEKKDVDGETFWYLGKTYPLEIVDGKRQPLELKGHFRIGRSMLSKAPALFKKWYKEEALREITQRVNFYTAKMGVSYRQIKITSAQTRWGSCSAQGTLCFTWRLVMAPLPVIDYVVVHELVHLLEKNHAKAFWSKVGVIMPDYKVKKEWLKKNSHLMRI